MNRQPTQRPASVSRGTALLAAPAHRDSTARLLAVDDPLPLAFTTKQPLLQVSNATAGVLKIAPQGLLTLLGSFTLALRPSAVVLLLLRQALRRAVMQTLPVPCLPHQPDMFLPRQRDKLTRKRRRLSELRARLALPHRRPVHAAYGSASGKWCPALRASPRRTATGSPNIYQMQRAPRGKWLKRFRLSSSVCTHNAEVEGSSPSLTTTFQRNSTRFMAMASSKGMAVTLSFKLYRC